MTAQYEKQILTLAKICVADQVARSPSQRDPDFVLEDATKAIEYMDTVVHMQNELDGDEDVLTS